MVGKGLYLNGLTTDGHGYSRIGNAPSANGTPPNCRGRSPQFLGLRGHDRALGLDDISSSPKAATCRRTPKSRRVLRRLYLLAARPVSSAPAPGPSLEPVLSPFVSFVRFVGQHGSAFIAHSPKSDKTALGFGSYQGFGRGELMDIYRLISEHRVVLLEQWHDYFNH